MSYGSSQTCTVAVELLQLSLHYMTNSSVTCYYGDSKNINQSIIILFEVTTTKILGRPEKTKPLHYNQLLSGECVCLILYQFKLAQIVKVLLCLTLSWAGKSIVIHASILNEILKLAIIIEIVQGYLYKHMSLVIKPNTFNYNTCDWKRKNLELLVLCFMVHRFPTNE